MNDEVKNEEKSEGTAEEAKESKEKAASAAEKAEEASETSPDTSDKSSQDNDRPEAAEAKEEPKEEAREESKTQPEPVKEEAKKPEEPKGAPKKEVKVSGKLADIIKEIEGLSVLELSDLVKALEDKFGVSATPTMMGVPAGAAPAAADEAGTEESQTTFNVILANSGANKISVIKAVRELVPTLGLKEAKDLVDAAPKQVLEGVGKDAAGEAKQKLETAGAKVELK